MSFSDLELRINNLEAIYALNEVSVMASKLQGKFQDLNKSGIQTVANFNKYVSYITRGFNLAAQLLNEHQKQTAAFQVAEMTAAVMNSFVTTANLELQAISSFAAGNWLQGGFLQGMAVMSSINQSKAVVAKYQAIQNQNYINSVSNQILTYD